MTIKRWVLKAVQLTMAPINRAAIALARISGQATLPIIFIVGPPRSGTTLLYQVLVQSLDLAYFTNFSAAFAWAPMIGFWIARRLRGKDTPSYQSDFGKTAGWWGPHEAGRFWYRWFPSGLHVYSPVGQLSTAEMRALRQEVASIVAAGGRPVVFKNTYNSMRIGALAEAFPEAVFLQMKRDPVDIAQSILTSRIHVNDDKSRWWSLPPKEIDEIKDKPYPEQIAKQVFYVYRQIEADRSRLGDRRFMDVEYKELCRAPAAVVEAIQSFLADRDIEADRIGDPPAEFPFSGGQKVNDEEYRELQSLTAELWAETAS